MDENEYNIEEISDSENTLHLKFSGDLNLNNATKIHTYFLDHCIEPNDLVLSFEKVESLDLSIIQIISALLIKRKSTEKHTAAVFNSNSSLSELLHKSGIIDLVEKLQNNKS